MLVKIMNISIKPWFNSKSFINRNNVWDTITRVKYNASSAAWSIKAKDCLNLYVERRSIKCLKENFGGFLSVRLRV